MRVFLLCLFLSSCGYLFEGAERSYSKTTISIPYVKGDAEGKLTSALTAALSASGAFECMQNGGSLTLMVNILSQGNDRIGYSYDRSGTKGTLDKNLLPTENRKNTVVEIKLVESASDEVILGPVTVSASIDYDYVDPSSIRDLGFNNHGKKETSLQFSLGQLDSVEGAQDDAASSLYIVLSKKIVDGILRKL